MVVVVRHQTKNREGTPAAAGTRGSRLHFLTGADFDELASGEGGVRACEALRKAQLSKFLLLLWNLVGVVRERFSGMPVEECVEESFSLINKLRRESSDVVTQVLLFPAVGAWLVHCLRRVRGVLPGFGPIEDDLGHLGGIATAAAFRACREFDLPLRVRHGAVMFPTLGLADVGGGSAWARAHGTGDDPCCVTIELPGRSLGVLLGSQTPTPCWLPTRRLVSSAGADEFEVTLEDTDPFRSCDILPVASRVDERMATHWQKMLDATWEALVRSHPHRAEVIGPGVSALIPLREHREGAISSATSADAPGGIALTAHADPVDLALTLVHEFQHLKLVALLDLIPLYRASPAAVYYAPWRADPRPFGGLLQGAYAFLGVAGFWFERWAKEHGGRALAASFEFAWCRQAVSDVLTRLLDADVLTDLGVRFVLQMAARVEGWRDAPIPGEAAMHAQDMAADTWAQWRLRNLRPDPVRIARWADAWLAGRSCPCPEAPATEILSGGLVSARHARFRLVHLRLGDPKRFQRILRSPADARAYNATPADAHYVGGDLDRAAELFRSELAHRPSQVTSFAGLALVRRRSQTPTSRLYVECPEALYALSDRLRALSGSGLAPDPDELAEWIAAARPPGDEPI